MTAPNIETGPTRYHSFYGVTPVVQAASPVATISASSTTTLCNAAVLEIQVALKNVGIMASA